jgi:hypothetical protein
MISRRIVATQFPSNSDQEASTECAHQGPMSLQNSCSFASYESHPQKLVRLIGCRDLNARNRNLRTALPLEDSGHQH